MLPVTVQAQEPVTPTSIPEGAFLPDRITDRLAEDHDNGSAAIRGKTRLREMPSKDLKADDDATVVVDNISLSEVKVQLFDFNGRELAPDLEIVSDADPLVMKIRHDTQFKPGRYRVVVKDDANQSYTQDFTWGVLAINTGKTFYAPGEDASIQMAVLDETGEMVCNADLTLTIMAPDGLSTTLTTKSGQIIVNPQCYSKDMTIIPDYQASFQTRSEGVYALELSATTPDGTYTISDAFEVKSKAAFTIERQTATRIYPPNRYPVTFTVTANEDFTGEIQESVPASFSISKGADEAVGKPFDTIRQQSAAEESDVLGAEMFNLGKPFKGDQELTLGFGRQHRDPKLSRKYTDFRVLGHDGVDFDLPMRTPVLATDDGKVVKAGDGDYGTTIVIEHSWGKSYYGHLDKILKPEGSEVKKGETIGLSGNSGLSSGPHLHFGIKPNVNDFNNGYFGKINPLPFLGMEDTGVEHGTVAGVSTSREEEVKQGVQVLTWNVSLRKGESVTLGYQYNAPLISPELYLLGPLQLVSDGKTVFSESRQWQVAADAVVVNGGIVSSEAQFGGLQRKVAYVNSNWYAFYTDGTDVFYKKSSDGITWGSAVNLDASEDNDADNYNPSIGVTGNRYIHVAYLDDSADQVQMLTLDTNTDTTPQTTVCGLTSPGAFAVSTYMVSVASLSGANAIVAYSDTSSGTNADVFNVTLLLGATCTVTDVHPGNLQFGTQGAGLTASDRPVMVPLTLTTAMMIYTDGSNLRSASFDAGRNEWTNNNTLIDAITDSTYSAVTNGSSVWVLTQNGSTATRLYSCCTEDFARTQIDTDTGTTNQDNLSDSDMFCPTADNCKIVYTDDIDTTPALKFVDCNDESCSAPTVSTIDTNLGDAGDSAGASIYCVTDGSPADGSDNCKVVYGDLLGGNSSDLIFVDCTNDEDCSTNTATQIDSDMASGNDTSIVHTSIYCISDTDCKFLYNDELTTTLFFVDCPDATCTSTGRVITALDTVYGTGGTQVAPWNDIYCVASDNCKLVYHDNNVTAGCADANSLCFIDCTADVDCSTNAKTVIDSDIGTTLGASPVAINCVGGDTECTIVYGDGTDGDLTFVDCEGSATCASGSTITDIDLTGGASTDTTLKVRLSCVSNTDCKIFYSGDLSVLNTYYIDCGNETCTSGSGYDLVSTSASRYAGDIFCLTTSNCKMVYYGSGANPAFEFGDCDTDGCVPTWTSQTAPWTSETNVISVSLTYDSTNADLIASIIKDASEQAYSKISDASSISWGADTAYSFTPGDLDNISAPESAAGTSLMGVLLRQGSNIEFSLYPSGPTLDQVMRHGKWFNSSGEQAFTF